MDETLITKCQKLDLQPQVEGDAIMVSMGQGLMTRQVTVHPAVPNDSTDKSRWAGGFARGLQAALGEPSNSHGEKLDFVDATPRLFMTLEAPSFVEAASAGLGEAIWTRPFVDDLQFVFRIELDNGQRVIPASQVDAWGVHPERIYKAAVSIVFHRTGYKKANRSSYGGMTVDEWAIGDGCDAARAAILDSIDFHRCRSGVYFGCPTPDRLLLIDADAGELDEFSSIVRQQYDHADFPLSSAVYAYEGGHMREEPMRH